LCINYIAIIYHSIFQLSPLVDDYRDLIFLAVDYRKQDIAERLTDLGADLKRKEQVMLI